MTWLVSAAGDPATSTDTIAIRPAKDDAMLLNPGKGWVQYYGSDIHQGLHCHRLHPVGVVRPGAQGGTVQLKRRLTDSSTSSNATARRPPSGVMSVSTGLGQQYVTPKWVFDAGAAPLAVLDDSSPTGQQIIPKTWDDPVILKKLSAFVQAHGQAL